MPPRINIGTAGWTIPQPTRELFPAEGSALERYSARLPVSEINSSFHRQHRVSTWERWRDSVPATFRFSVKIPKAITHVAKLRDCSALLDQFIAEASRLRGALAVLLVQLPPKLDFDVRVAETFFSELKSRTAAQLACEPRNASWFDLEAEQLLAELQVARVAADPAICASASSPGGWDGLRYWRLHGSPSVYRSSYADRIPFYADRLREFAGPMTQSWCIFDNTASSAAMADALLLIDAIRGTTLSG